MPISLSEQESTMTAKTKTTTKKNEPTKAETAELTEEDLEKVAGGNNFEEYKVTYTEIKEEVGPEVVRATPRRTGPR